MLVNLGWHKLFLSWNTAGCFTSLHPNEGSHSIHIHDVEKTLGPCRAVKGYQAHDLVLLSYKWYSLPLSR